jgi:hypothetical protein
MSSPAKDPSPSGFLSRWSQRKAQVRQGAQTVEPTPAEQAPEAPTAEASPVPIGPPAAPTPPPPTLADVAAHDERSPDFSRFVAPGVDNTVRNAALHKLFSDPHFNVMDGLDIYIDDYGLADPIPPAMLRQMVQSQALGLFDHEKTDADVPPSASADTAGPVEPANLADQPTDKPLLADAPAPTDDSPSLPESRPDENADLRLQPDHAAGRSGPEPGPGQDPGR